MIKKRDKIICHTLYCMQNEEWSSLILAVCIMQDGHPYQVTLSLYSHIEWGFWVGLILAECSMQNAECRMVIPTK